MKKFLIVLMFSCIPLAAKELKIYKSDLQSEYYIHSCTKCGYRNEIPTWYFHDINFTFHCMGCKDEIKFKVVDSKK